MQAQAPAPSQISLRGAKESSARRTALISFEDPQQTSVAMNRGRYFQGSSLHISYYRPSEKLVEEQPTVQQQQQTPPSNELVFSYVPDDLFSREAILHLFNSICSNMVTDVSVRSRRHKGVLKRTAIVTFASVAAATTALKSLPFYNGQQLNVVFRHRSRHNLAPRDAPASRSNRPADDMAIVGNFNVVQADGTNGDVVIEAGELIDVPEYSDPFMQSKPSHRDKSVAPIDLELEKEKLKAKINERVLALRNKHAREREKKAQGQSNRPDSVNTVPAPRINTSDVGGIRKTSKDVVSTESHYTPSHQIERIRVDLSKAVPNVGGCQTMCPKNQIEYRILKKDFHPLETVDFLGVKPDPNLFVKTFNRPGSGKEASVDDCRTPAALLKTMKHLISLFDVDEHKVPFHSVAHFLFDRTRQVRNDVDFQGGASTLLVPIFEGCVRFHMMLEHRLVGVTESNIVFRQNRLELNRCFTSLRHVYQHRQMKSLPALPNEDEMEAYFLLSRSTSPETCATVSSELPQQVRSSLPVHFALEVIRASSDASGDYFGYFSCLRAAPYLMACLMHYQFWQVRWQALKRMNKVFGKPTLCDRVEIATLTQWLEFEDDEETERFCEDLDLKILKEGGGDDAQVSCVPFPQNFDIQKTYDSAAGWEKSRADRVVEGKSVDLTPTEIINGVHRYRFDFQHLRHCTSSHLKVSLEELQRLTDASRRQGVLSSTVIEPAVSGTNPKKRESPTKQAPKVSILERLGLAPVPKLPHAPIHAHNPVNIFKSKSSLDEEAGGNTETWNTLAAQRKSNSPMQDSRGLVTGMSQKHEPAVNIAKTESEVINLPLMKNNKASLKRVSIVPEVTQVASQYPTTSEIKALPTETLGADVIFNRSKRPAPDASVVRDYETRKINEAVLGKFLKSQTNHELEQRTVTGNDAVVPIESAGSNEKEDTHGNTIEEERQKSRLAAHGAYLEFIEDLVEEVESLRNKVSRIETIFFSASAETYGASKILELCSTAKSDFKTVAAAIKSCLIRLNVKAPVSDVAKKARDSLIGELEEIKKSGNKVWQHVKKLGAFASTAPIHMMEPIAMKKIQSGKALQSSLGMKRKATMDGMMDGGRAAKKRSATCSASVGERCSSNEELRVISQTMRDSGLIRWEASICEGHGICSQREKMLNKWVRGRFSGNLDVRDGVIQCINEEDSSGCHHISVTTASIGQAVSSTSNVVIFSVDTFAEVGYRHRLTHLRGILLQRQSRGKLVGSIPPVLILVTSSKRPMQKTGFSAANIDALATDLHLLLDNKGLVLHIHIVDVSVTCAEYMKENVELTAAIRKTVLQVQEELKRSKLNLQPVILGEHVVHLANSAWLRYISNTTGPSFDSASHLKVIDCVNKSWSAFAKTVGEEERRWPVEMKVERRRLREVKVLLRRKMRLPLPSDINVTSAGRYIAHLARSAGIACPTLGNVSSHPVAHFCRSLGHVLVPFVSSVLQRDYFRRLYIPRVALPPSSSGAFYKLGRTLCSDSDDAISRPVSVEHAWDGTPVALKNSTRASIRSRIVAQSWTRPRRSSLSLKLAGSGAMGRPRRQSMEVLKRTLDFSPDVFHRRKSLPVKSDEAKEMFLFYDELCRTEEAHAALLRETELTLLAGSP